jgi:hypothetical protein
VGQPTNRSPLGFKAQTKKSPQWFWDPNHQTVAAGFETQTGKLSTIGFEARPGETVTTDFETKPEKTVTTGFEAKPLSNRLSGFEAKLVTNSPSGFEAKPLTNNRPWFWGTVHIAHSVIWPLDLPATEYPTCATIPGPLHQVFYS